MRALTTVLLVCCVVVTLTTPVFASYSESTYYAPNCMIPSFQVHGPAVGTLTVTQPSGHTKDIPFDVRAGCVVIELPPEYQRLTLKTSQGRKELERTRYGYALVKGRLGKSRTAVFARWSVWGCGRVAIIYDAFSQLEKRYDTYIVNYDDFGGLMPRGTTLTRFYHRPRGISE